MNSIETAKLPCYVDEKSGKTVHRGGCGECPPETATHTPGPWKLEVEREGPRSGFFVTHNISDEDGYTILATYGDVDDTDEANARLIAAAPELLTALEACLPNVPGWNTKDFAGRPWLEQAAAAIRKVKGEL